MKRIFKLVGLAIFLVLAYVIGSLIYGTLTDWKPQGLSSATVSPSSLAQDTIRDSVLNFVTWNIGYGGLGSDAEFFLDAGHFYVSGGRMVHSPEDHVERYMRGIKQQVASLRTEFILLQEVDSMSARSYHREQYEEIKAEKPQMHASFAANYISKRVPVPVFEPWNIYGDVHSGIATLSAYSPVETPQRHQLPGEFPWPDKLFQLDRCLLVNRYALADGRELTVVNLHLSAYDDGSIKASQLGYLADFLKAEEDAGHLVVVGGDWNLVPPNFAYDTFISDPEGDFQQFSAPKSFPREGWTYVYDARVPTNRKIPAPYIRDSSFVTVIDYFLISPGLRAVQARGIRQDFQFSDHQPVWMAVEIE